MKLLSLSSPSLFEPQARQPLAPRLRHSQDRMRLLLLCATLLLAPAAAASAQATTQSAPQAADQYSGVSHPPADDAIVAAEDPAAPSPQKPLPGVPAAAPEARPATQYAAPAAAAAAPVENPDYGIVTSTTDTPAPQTAAERNAHLIPRPVDPDYGVVGMVAAPSNQLAEGTNVHVRLLQQISTQRSQDGEPFRAQVAADVYKEGRVVIPMGSELRGRIVSVSQGHRMGNRATIRLRPDSVILPDGTAYHLFAQAVSSSQSGTRTDQEGGIQPKPQVTKDLVEYGTGAGSGALVGGVFGGPVGAGAGALVGAGVVTTHLLLQKPAQARIEQGAEIVFSLTEPMDLLPTRN